MNNNSLFDKVYQDYLDDLYSYGRGMGFSHENCLDAIQDIFCNIYARNNIQNLENIKYYLFRSLKNRLIDIYRNNKNTDSETGVQTLIVTFDETVIDTLIEKEEQQLLQHKIETLLNSLSNKQREAIYLRYMQEFEYEEIASLLDISPESARKLIYRGINKLRENAGENYLLHYAIGLLLLNS